MEETVRKKLYCFDFDGTLTTSDTMLELIKFAHGKGGLLRGLLANAFWLVLMKLHFYPNWKSKEKVLAWFFGGMEVEDFKAICQVFAMRCHTLIRPSAIAEITGLMSKGDMVVVVSASADDWVRPMLEKVFPHVPALLSTRLEVVGDKISGRISGNNCHGQEKVERIKQYLKANGISRNDCYIYAYGDSKGDKEMMEYADESFYKPFRD